MTYPALQTDPDKIQAVLDELSIAGVLSDENLNNVQSELQRGSPLYAALSLHGNEDLIWAHFAREAGLDFYPRHTDLKTYTTDLMTFDECLRSGILPHRPKGAFTEVVTFQKDILDHPPRQIDGARARYSLISPTTYKHLFHLGYPEPLTGKLSLSQSQALVTSTRENEGTSMSPEQRSEMMALSRGYRYIDIRRDPPEEEAAALVSLSMMLRTKTYPHHIAGTQLAILTTDPENTDNLQALTRHTQMKIIPILTTPDAILKLIREAEESARAQTAQPPQPVPTAYD